MAPTPSAARIRHALLLFLPLLAPVAVAAQAPSWSGPPLVVVPAGRVQLDGAVHHGAAKAMSNGVDLRRVRLGLEGSLDAWTFQVEADLSGDGAEVKDAWVSRAFPGGLLLRVGNFKEPFSLEELTSSRFLTFQERGLPNALAPGRSLGASLTAAGGTTWWASAGLFGQEADELGESELGDAEGWAATGRALFRSWGRPTRILQLGASATRRTPDADEGGGDEVRFRAYPEGKLERTRFLNTGKIKGTDHHRALGLEALAVLGGAAIQAEHIGATVVRSGAEAANADLDGSYVHARWLFGGVRRYDALAAELAEVHPSSSRGALEVGLRFSRLDLTDAGAGVEGGFANQWTVGATWHLTSRAQWSIHHVWVDNDDLADGDGDFVGDDDFGILQTRFQLWF